MRTTLDTAPPFGIKRACVTVYYTLVQDTSLPPPQCPGTLPHSEADRRADNSSIYRSLGQLFASSDRLSGEEAQTLREYCNTVEIEPEKSLKDPYGILLKEANLTAFQEHFESRVQHFEGRRHEAAQELFKLRWGATRIPIYLVLLAFTNQPGDALRHKYFTLAKWLVETAKVPVDGT